MRTGSHLEEDGELDRQYWTGHLTLPGPNAEEEEEEYYGAVTERSVPKPLPGTVGLFSEVLWRKLMMES